MVRTLLIRGMLAGLVAGLLAFGFAWLFGEPPVSLAIELEEHARHAAGEAAEPELVSRAVQGTIGLLTGVVVYGCALGGLFALAFALAVGRLGTLGARATAAALGLVGFAALVLVPQVKYPANPPAVGDPETIGVRTVLYLAMLVLSVACAVAALGTGRLLAARLGRWNAVLAGGGLYLAATATAMAVLPRVDEVPATLPATLLWQFRLASLGTHAVLWATLALVFGAWAERSVGRRAIAPHAVPTTP